jgi:RHS repeat-associated protein
MLPNRETRLCSYRYDPLDRLVDCTPSAQPPTRRFYLKDRLATEIQGAVQRSIMQHDDQLLAQQQRQSGAMEARLLATDRQRSVLNVLDVARLHPLAYSPYGHRPAESGLLSLLGFNGERPDLVTGCYLLGNGYRAFNPVLMRFNSPDSWSPFGEGGLNGYAYCVGDPVNRHDPSGHTWKWLKNVLRLTGLMRKKTPVVGLRSNRAGARTPLQGNQLPSNTSIASERISNGQTNLSGTSKTEPLNITKEEATKKISTLKELQTQMESRIKELDKKSNDLGNTIASQESRKEKYLYGRRLDRETPPSNTLELIYERNAIRNARIEHTETLRSSERLIEKYSRYT